MRAWLDEVICMNFEHDNEFGQRPDGSRRDPSMRNGRQNRQRDTSSQDMRPAQSRNTEPQRGYRRDMGDRYNTGGRRIPPSSGREGISGSGSLSGRTGSVRISDAERAAAARRAAAGREPGMGRSVSSVRAQGPGEEMSGSRGDRSRRTSGSLSSGSRRAGTIPPPGESVRGQVAQGKIQKAKQRRMKKRIIAMIIAECFALLFIFTYGYFARRFTMIQRPDFDPKTVGNNEISLDTLKKMKGYRMIAVFGVDSRDGNVGAGSQSDVIMICCINEDTGEIKLVSVYRDTYLNINDEGSYRKVNAAYTNGGPQQALKTLNKNLDLNITDYITFSWRSVAEGINILGGVDVEITKSEFKYINGFITETVKATDIGSHHLKGPGMQHLDGVQAVAYGRLRLMDTDYARTERQRKIIELAFAKAKQADYSVLNNILVVVLPNVSTNITFADMTTMALGIGKYHMGETAGFPFAKGNANMPGKGDCVIPQTLESNVKQLHTFLFGDEDYETTDQVKQISDKIASDSGMYKEGQPFKGSALSTDGYVPEEPTRPASTEKETTAQEEETDEDGNAVIPWETDEEGNIIGIYPGMTDENGELIDAPIDDWPEEEVPNPNGPGFVRPTQPGQPGGSQGPGESSAAGTNPGPGGSNSQGPGVQNPSESSPGPAGPGGTTEPGGTGEPGNGTITPGDNSTESPGDGQNSGPSVSPSTPTLPWQAGPGTVGQNGNGAQGPGDGASGNGNGGPEGPNPGQ